MTLRISGGELSPHAHRDVPGLPFLRVSRALALRDGGGGMLAPNEDAAGSPAIPNVVEIGL
ncbi:MAG: hypothetical protein GXP34_09525 [Actinobacteria bacterium]|nr:hypothetical protein [Actinomycetota bacterium]